MNLVIINSATRSFYMKLFLTIFLTMGLVACSGSKLANNAQDGLDEAGTELEAGADEFADDIGFADEGEGGDEFGEEEFGEEEFAEGGDEATGGEGFGAEETTDSFEASATDEVVQEDISPGAGDFSPAPSTQMTGSNGVYQVQSGDTLMIIAFKIYGKYDMWRSIARRNSGKLGPNHSVSIGMSLSYDEPAQKFEWNPSGNPYLIRSGDTLGTISKDTYGTMSYWKNIWTNNKPLIQDPNRIFAGFTIYTPVIEARGVANNVATEVVDDVANEDI